MNDQHRGRLTRVVLPGGPMGGGYSLATWAAAIARAQGWRVVEAEAVGGPVPGWADWIAAEAQP